MSFLNWFASKSKSTPTGSHEDLKRLFAGRDSPAVPMPQRLAPQTDGPKEGGRLKRYARREQLYVAIREAMTRAGVLSASYKFKVLSVDQPGNEFLVMMDVAKAFGRDAAQLAEIEALIVQNALARFEITVPAVYWRVDLLVSAITPRPAAQAAGQTGETSAVERARAELAKRAEARYEPIQADEVAAFKQALMAASPQGAAAAGQGVKTHSGPRSYALLTGFEDTEMTDAGAAPALSNTQYGDLN